MNGIPHVQNNTSKFTYWHSILNIFFVTMWCYASMTHLYCLEGRSNSNSTKRIFWIIYSVSAHECTVFCLNTCISNADHLDTNHWSLVTSSASTPLEHNRADRVDLHIKVDITYQELRGLFPTNTQVKIFPEISVSHIHILALVLFSVGGLQGFVSVCMIFPSL